MIVLERALLFVVAAGFPAFAAAQNAGSRPGAESRPDDRRTLFERVADRLRVAFKPEIKTGALEALLQKHRGAFDPSAPLDAQREVIRRMLAEIPASHLAIVSTYADDRLFAELEGSPRPTAGFQLIEIDGSYYVDHVLRGGPAAAAGIQRGERVTEIDGTATAASPRLDWRSDDAFLSDPIVHLICCDKGDRITFTVEQRRDEPRRVDVAARTTSSLRSDLASARIIEQGGFNLAVLAVSYCYRRIAGELVAPVRDLSKADALLLDMRGRGGADPAGPLLNWLDGTGGFRGKPVVALADRNTRSAKEIFLNKFKTSHRGTIVGEHTECAVRPVTRANVGFDSVLLSPTGPFAAAGVDDLEGKGVEPDVRVADVFPWCNGRDPIFTAGLDLLESQCAARASERPGSAPPRVSR